MPAATAVDDPMAILNPAQREAATYGCRREDVFEAGPLLIIAGAGTGKTMTLAHRVAHLIIEGVRPERILLLTFTRRAAQEMGRRVDSIVRSTLANQAGGLAAAGVLPWSGTFHSVANRLLRRYAANLELDPGFSVLDRGDAADLLDVTRHELGLSRKSRRFPKKDTCLAIYSRCVNAQASLPDVLTDSYPWCSDWESELRELFRHYVERKQQTQSLDYDDLLLYWYHLVEDEEFATEIGASFDHVLVDEYQDTNLIQAKILRSLKPCGDGVTVVGDDAQSIYSFRAAEVENILGFPDQFMPTAQVIALEENYRSTQAILDSANRLIAESDRQYRKHLFSRNRQGARPRYVTVEDADAEAAYVVDEILDNRERGMQLMDQAVLFRGSHHSDRLELELVRRNIPYVKYGGLKFLEAAHVKDVLSVLKWAENPRNEVAAFRVLKLLPQDLPAMERLARAARPGPPLVPATSRASLRRPRHTPGRSRTAGADFGPVPDAREVPHRAHARPAECGRRPGRRSTPRRGLPGVIDRAFGQGTGMGSRLPAQRIRWRISIRVRDRQAGVDRGRTATTLRRDDPGQADAVAHCTAQVSRHAAAQGRGPPRLRCTEPLPDPATARHAGAALFRCGGARGRRPRGAIEQAARRRRETAADVVKKSGGQRPPPVSTKQTA